MRERERGRERERERERGREGERERGREIGAATAQAPGKHSQTLPLPPFLPSFLPLHSPRQRWLEQAQCEQELDALEQRRLTKFLEDQRL
jgi:hypothetical protein